MSSPARRWLNRNFPSLVNKLSYLERKFSNNGAGLGATSGGYMSQTNMYYGNVPANVDEEDIYLTEDGYMEVAFWYHRCGDGTWRAYIISDINYCGRAADAHSSHRYHDGTLNLYYVCYEPEIRTKAEAKNVSADWADLTSHYIQTGTGF